MLLGLDRRLWPATTLAGGILFLIPVRAVVISPIVPIPLRLIVIALWLAAVARPHAALLALALLVPFGSAMTMALDAPPTQFSEALALATLSGLLIAAAFDRRPSAAAPSPPIGLPAALLGAVVTCSLAVVLAVSQVGIGRRWLFFSNVGTFIARDYLVAAPGQWTGIAAAALLLEGVLLLLLVIRFSANHVTHPLQLLKATAAAAAIAALLSLSQLVRLLWILAVSVPDLIGRLLISRVSVHVADTNAAGSYYAMAAFVAFALVMHDRERRGTGRIWAVMTAAIILEMWVTGSRTAGVATAVVFCVWALAAGRAVWRRAPGWLIVAGVGLCCIVGALALGFDPRAATVGRGLGRTFESRAAFVVTGLRMIGSAPVFGVGIGRYFEMSGRFMPQSIYWFFFHENAHNNFLQIGGELGLTGLAAFVWLLVAGTQRIVRGRRASIDDRLLTGAFAGLAAFVITWLTGHPLLTPEVAFPFWILAGAAVARADGDRRTPLTPQPADARETATARAPQLIVPAVILALAASVPLRVRDASAGLNLSEQTFGFYEWEGNPPGRMRWTSPSAGFFVPAHATEVEIPMRALFSERRTQPTVVSIAIDGRVFHRLEISNGDVFTLALRLPIPAVPATQPRRVDIITNPPWSPAEALGTSDTRVLGVQLGDVTAR